MKPREARKQITCPGAMVAELGAYLRACRQRERMTTGELSERSGVPVSTISRFERTGLGSTDTMAALLCALGELDIMEFVIHDRFKLSKLESENSMHGAKKRVRHAGCKHGNRKHSLDENSEETIKNVSRIEHNDTDINIITTSA